MSRDRILLCPSHTRLIHVVANGRIFFLRIFKKHFLLLVFFFLHIHFSLFLYPFTHQGTLGLFPFLAIVNNDIVNVEMQEPLWDTNFIPFGYMILRREFLDHTIAIFLILWERWTNVHSHTLYKCSCFSTSFPVFIFGVLITVILTDLRWYVIVVWICVSLMTSDVEHLFIYLLAIGMSSLGNV